MVFISSFLLFLFPANLFLLSLVITLASQSQVASLSLFERSYNARMVGGDSAGDTEGDFEEHPSAIPRPSPSPIPSSTSAPAYSTGGLLDLERPLPAAFVESALLAGLDVQEACETTEENCNRQGQSERSKWHEVRSSWSSSPAKGSPVWGNSLSGRDNDLRGFSSQREVIFAASHRLRSWAILHKTDLQCLVVAASQHLDRVAKDIYSRAYGWRSSLRIDSH